MVGPKALFYQIVNTRLWLDQNTTMTFKNSRNHPLKREQNSDLVMMYEIKH